MDWKHVSRITLLAIFRRTASNKKGLADNAISRGRKNLDVHVVLNADSYLDLSNRRMFVVGD